MTPKLKQKSGFEYDPNCARIVSLASGDVILRNPVTGKNQRLVAKRLGENAYIAIPEELHDHPSYRALVSEIEATGRVVGDVQALTETLEILDEMEEVA